MTYLLAAPRPPPRCVRKGVRVVAPLPSPRPPAAPKKLQTLNGKPKRVILCVESSAPIKIYRVGDGCVRVLVGGGGGWGKVRVRGCVRGSLAGSGSGWR